MTSNGGYITKQWVVLEIRRYRVYITTKHVAVEINTQRIGHLVGISRVMGIGELLVISHNKQAVTLLSESEDRVYLCLANLAGRGSIRSQKPQLVKPS